MNNTEKNDTIPVCIWYEDIDQEQVNEQTFIETGLRIDDCDITPSLDVNRGLTDLDGSSDIISEYLKSTTESREREEEITDTYRNSHMNIAIDMYNTKSNNLVRKLGIENDKICFKSELAPMIIANLSVDEINSIKNSDEIIDLSLSVSREIADDDNPDYNNRSNNNIDESILNAYESIGLDKLYQYSDLDGSNVKIGLEEGDIPGVWINYQGTEEVTYSYFGFSSDNLLSVSYNPYIEYEMANSHIIVQNAVENFQGAGPLKVIAVAVTQNESYFAPEYQEVNGIHGHENNSVKTMISQEDGIARGAQVYAAMQNPGNLNYFAPGYKKYANLETIIKCGISVLVVNIHDPNIISMDNITDTIKYNDHIAACHGITVIVPGGDGTYYDTYGEWMNCLGLAENVITVGAYEIVTDPISNESIYRRKNYRWKNADEYLATPLYACEKPDVLMPCSFNYGATSTAAPAMAAVIALLMELKPSLKTQPETVKAIVLASCHTKAEPSALPNEPTETMSSGIPEREHTGSASSISEYQGAGIPNAWTMVKTICQHTYGCGTLTQSSPNLIRIVQPSYGASNINFSLSWLRDAEETNTGHFIDDDITLSNAADLKLKVYNNNNQIACSDLINSSTEMCYVPILNNYGNNYCLKVTHDNYTLVRYGYAWSTDNMRLFNETDSGLYYLRNYYSFGTKYLMKDSANAKGIISQPSATTYTLASDYEWIFKTGSNSSCSLQSTSGSGLDYLGVGSYYSSTLHNTALFDSLCSLRYRLNDDGTVSIFNSNYTKILRASNTKAFWNNYVDNQTIHEREKWYFDRINFLKGDLDTDGSVDITDVTRLQRHILFEPDDDDYYATNKTQEYLADFNGDNTVDAGDIQALLLFTTNYI